MPNSIEKMVYNAIKQRQHKSEIANEIKVGPEFRDMFTGPYSLIGQEGGTIKTLRIEHKKIQEVIKKEEYLKLMDDFVNIYVEYTYINKFNIFFIKTLRIDHKKVPRNYKKRRVFKINA